MAKSVTGSNKDKVAAYMQELLSLDSDEQKGILDALTKYRWNKSTVESSYAGLGSSMDMPGQASASGGSSLADLIFMAQEASQPSLPNVSVPFPAMANTFFGQAQSTGQNKNPLKVELPGVQSLGSMEEMPGQTVQRLQHATQMLQAAVENWEACVQDTNAPANSAAHAFLEQTMMENMVQAQRQAQARMHAPGMPPAPPGLPARAKAAEVNAQSVTDYAKMLEKALVNLNTSLPPHASEMAQSLLENIASDPSGEAQASLDQERMKWLSKHLETQNRASIAKLMGYASTDKPRAYAAQRGQAQAQAAYGFGARGAAGSMPPGLAAGAGAGPNSMWNLGRMHNFGLPLAASPPAEMHSAYPMPLAGAHNKWWEGDMNSQTSAEMARKGGGPKKRITGPTTSPGDVPPQAETLRMHLRSLLSVDSNRVLIVRKINRLGFASPNILKEHFAWYGTVENVLVAHSRVKSGGGQAGIVSRLRPSGLGFVVMSKTEEADAILAQGPEQQVCNTLIRVQKFERRMTDMPEDDMHEQDDEKVDEKEMRIVGA
eukprot:TRINITY_DN2425_c0_g1_i1.p1 TRINITY_DN2425_c0_g1~~TRINITY_DN2425_c0_g1_i1.p1  ORF type:complete len:545 (-),score=142.69 TRINITY_DN2425_c0_g1_i1:440-2074(-)